MRRSSIISGALVGLLVLTPAISQDVRNTYIAVAAQIADNTITLAKLNGLGTNVATALGIAVGSAGGPVTNGGALGTPSSGTATNLSGTAASLTAGNVTTNANLTGYVTSVGNATSLAAVPNFKVTLTSSQSVTTSTWTKVTFDTVVIDNISYWDTTNKYYKPLVSGTYVFCAVIGGGGTFTLGADNFIISFSKNGLTGGAGTRQGTVVMNVPTLASADPALSGCTSVAMNGSTDTLELDALVTATSPVVGGSANATSYLLGYRISP